MKLEPDPIGISLHILGGAYFVSLLCVDQVAEPAKVPLCLSTKRALLLSPSVPVLIPYLYWKWALSLTDYHEGFCFQMLTQREKAW